jgi:XTP/dITP diphosphohydrolase
MNKLLVATRNPGKLDEIKSILKGIPWRIVSLTDIGLGIPVAETGETYEENATLKATAYGDASGLVTLADDSGLEVDALNNRPGVHSARYAPGSDDDRIDQLLAALSHIPPGMRQARFVAAVTIYDPKSKKTESVQGVSMGSILTKPVGRNGFGYDPVFFNDDLGKSNGEATEEEKNSVSHRARALQAALPILEKIRLIVQTNGGLPRPSGR